MCVCVTWEFHRFGICSHFLQCLVHVSFQFVCWQLAFILCPIISLSLYIVGTGRTSNEYGKKWNICLSTHKMVTNIVAISSYFYYYFLLKKKMEAKLDGTVQYMLWTISCVFFLAVYFLSSKRQLNSEITKCKRKVNEGDIGFSPFVTVLLFRCASSYA